MDWAVTNLWGKFVKSGDSPSGRGIGAMAVFEQAAYRAAKKKVCIRCGDPGTIKVGPHQFLQSTHYFECAGCAAN